MTYDKLSKDKIQRQVNDYFDIHIIDTIDSTNDAIKRNAKYLNDGFVLIANSQTKGKGRNNNSFISPSDNGIYLSLFIKPRFNIKDTLKIVALSSLVISKSIEEIYNLKPAIKWVNDVLINDKKVSGILCETSLSNGSIDYLVLGMGINLHSYKMSDELINIAGCIEDFSDKYISRNDFIAHLLNNFYDLYNNLDYNFINEYKKYSCILNKDIKVIEPNNTYECKAIDIDDNGYLIVLKDNKKFPLVSGEIHIRKIHT